jgi:hypothetical protein
MKTEAKESLRKNRKNEYGEISLSIVNCQLKMLSLQIL